jgi:hypothetical protein
VVLLATALTPASGKKRPDDSPTFYLELTHGLRAHMLRFVALLSVTKFASCVRNTSETPNVSSSPDPAPEAVW